MSSGTFKMSAKYGYEDRRIGPNMMGVEPKLEVGQKRFGSSFLVAFKLKWVNLVM